MTEYFIKFNAILYDIIIDRRRFLTARCDVMPRGMTAPVSDGKEEPLPWGQRSMLNQFELRRALGRGSYGKVVLVRHRTSRKLFAMKVIFSFSFSFSILQSLIIRCFPTDDVSPWSQPLNLNSTGALKTIHCGAQPGGAHQHRKKSSWICPASFYRRPPLCVPGACVLPSFLPSSFLPFSSSTYYLP